MDTTSTLKNSNQTFDFTFPNVSSNKPVECLGHTFEHDTARQAYFIEKLREQLQKNEFKNIAGFPSGSEQAILALSDPPYYTACPNPWLSDLIKEWATRLGNSQTNHRQAFATDVSEGKKDFIDNAYPYPNKLPHKAIMHHILHYTQPGEIIFDGFAGTGMTGVAAQLCGDKKRVESLGYRVLGDGTILNQQNDENGKLVWKPFSKLGARRAILTDLSPATTLIAYNYNIPTEILAFEPEVMRILAEVEAECGWMYQTLHICHKNIQENTDIIQKVIEGKMACPDWLIIGQINYTVLSEVFTCPQCRGEVIFWKVAVSKQTGKVQEVFPCPHCATQLTKSIVERVLIMELDNIMGEMVKKTKWVPVLINYSIENQYYEKYPDEFDFALLAKIEQSEIPYRFPTEKMEENSESRTHQQLGITQIYHFYTKRNLWVLSALMHKTAQIQSNSLQNLCIFLFQQGIISLSKLNRYLPTQSTQNNPNLGETLHISSQLAEISPNHAFRKKIPTIKMALANNHLKTAIISTQTADHLEIPDSSIDYIFIAPPLSAHLPYSALHFLQEAWLNIFSNYQSESIMTQTPTKDFSNYWNEISHCLTEAFRLLKPGRWLTIAFTSTQASVWHKLQTILQQVGFVIANISNFYHKSNHSRAINPSAVKQDLMIQAYKPNAEQDNLIFRPEQILEYECLPCFSHQAPQMEMAIFDERSTINWLHHFLAHHPATYQELYPIYLRKLGAGWKSYEIVPELDKLLEFHFIKYNGKGKIPASIDHYLSNYFKQLHHITADDKLIQKYAKSRWYLPDTQQASQLAQRHEKQLLRDFATYYKPHQKRLKHFRLEAIHAGFKKAWEEGNYHLIIQIANHLPDSVLPENDKLLLWYDQALMRISKE